jgi:hypothetical protein
MYFKHNGMSFTKKRREYFIKYSEWSRCDFIQLIDRSNSSNNHCRFMVLLGTWSVSRKHTHTTFLILYVDGKERAGQGRLGPLLVFKYTAAIGCWQLLTSRDNDNSPRTVILLFPSPFICITSDTLSGDPVSWLCHGKRPRVFLKWTVGLGSEII